MPLVDGFLDDEGLVEEVMMHLYQDIYLPISYEALVILVADGVCFNNTNHRKIFLIISTQIIIYK